MRIGILGATGPAGRGLAARLASCGHEVIAGSRDRARAEAKVGELRDAWGERVASLRPGDNAEAATGEMVVVAVPWEAAGSTAAEHRDALAGKVVVSMANGLTKVGREFHPVFPPEGSVAAHVAHVLPASQVVSAFHLVAAAEFAALDRPMDADIVVCGDDDDARAQLRELIHGIPDLRSFDAGSLANAVGLEAFTSVLLTVNLRHKGKSGLRLLGVEP